MRRALAAAVGLSLVALTALPAHADPSLVEVLGPAPADPPAETPPGTPPLASGTLDGATTTATAAQPIRVTRQQGSQTPETIDARDVAPSGPVEEYVPPICRLLPGPTGAEAAASGGVPYIGFTPELLAMYATADGRYYLPGCDAVPGDTPVAADERIRRIQAQYPNPVWVPAGSAPPDVQVSVEDLLYYAVQTQSRTVPAPVVGLNPEAQTVTGLQTWVWPRQQTFTGYTVRAAAGTQFAEVTVTPRTLTVAAPGAKNGPCTAPRVYEAGLPDSATDCWLVFDRSSASSPGGTVPVTVTAVFDVTWSGSDGTTNAPLPDVTTTSTVPIGVAQVQSIVR